MEQERYNTVEGLFDSLNKKSTCNTMKLSNPLNTANYVDDVVEVKMN